MVGGAGLLGRPERREFSGGLRGNRMEPCNYSAVKEERKIKGNEMTVNVIINRVNHKRSVPVASQWRLERRCWAGGPAQDIHNFFHICLHVRRHLACVSTHPTLQKHPQNSSPSSQPIPNPALGAPLTQAPPRPRQKFLQDLWGR